MSPTGVSSNGNFLIERQWPPPQTNSACMENCSLPSKFLPERSRAVLALLRPGPDLIPKAKLSTPDDGKYAHGGVSRRRRRRQLSPVRIFIVHSSLAQVREGTGGRVYRRKG